MASAESVKPLKLSGCPPLPSAWPTTWSRYSRSDPTQMLLPSKAIPKGKLPTPYVPTTAPVLANNLVTLLLTGFATQMLVPSKAIPSGSLPQLKCGREFWQESAAPCNA
jgi:hypothetical protein